MNLARARRVLWATDEVCQRIAELQDLCRVLIADAERSDVTIADLKAEVAMFRECETCNDDLWLKDQQDDPNHRVYHRNGWHEQETGNE
jgi:hypothetical protein